MSKMFKSIGALFSGPEEDPNAKAQAELQGRDLADTRRRQAEVNAEKAALTNNARGGRLGRSLLAFAPTGELGAQTLG